MVCAVWLALAVTGHALSWDAPVVVAFQVSQHLLAVLFHCRPLFTFSPTLFTFASWIPPSHAL